MYESTITAVILLADFALSYSLTSFTSVFLWDVFVSRFLRYSRPCIFGNR